MNQFNQSEKQGFSYWWKNKATGFTKFLIVVLPLAAIGYFLYQYAPGLRTDESKKVKSLDVSNQDVNNVTTSAELSLPENNVSSKVSGKPAATLAGYAWNAQSGMMVANGGPQTTAGSLMEKYGVNLKLVRQDWYTELRNLQITFVDEFDRGVAHPTKGAFGVMLMGDGGPFYVSVVQQALDEKFGKGKYHAQIYGSIGLSYGEDQIIGPVEWKNNPQSMKGALIVTVPGDGDWVVLVNFCAINGLKINPDPNTYDPDAVNIKAAQDGDYVKSAEELIKSQTTGFSISLKEVKNGKLTGKTVDKKIDGCATWTPADNIVFEKLTGFTSVASTKEFNNQMACTIIAIKEWVDKNTETVTNIFKAALTAGNQMKQYESWRVKASEAAYKTFKQESASFWYRMFQGVDTVKSGTPMHLGGSRVFNLADVKQYYGLNPGDNTNRYRAVYDQVSQYLRDLNPDGFNQNVKRIVPYEEAVNLSIINKIGDIESGQATVSDYTKTATTSIGSGNWHINFNTGSAVIKGDSYSTLDQIYRLLINAENAKLELEGHTDNTGGAAQNTTLSKERALAVKAYLLKKGVPESRFQAVTGMGQDAPVADNTTEAGRAQNRRVAITLLQ